VTKANKTAALVCSACTKLISNHEIRVALRAIIQRYNNNNNNNNNYTTGSNEERDGTEIKISKHNSKT
jgi:disulfide oxidoreductase YuzD